MQSRLARDDQIEDLAGGVRRQIGIEREKKVLPAEEIAVHLNLRPANLNPPVDVGARVELCLDRPHPFRHLARRQGGDHGVRRCLNYDDAIIGYGKADDPPLDLNPIAVAEVDNRILFAHDPHPLRRCLVGGGSLALNGDFQGAAA